MYLLILFLPFYFTLSGFQSGGTEMEALPSYDPEKLKIQIQKSLEAISIKEKELQQLKEHVLVLLQKNEALGMQARWETDIVPICRQTIEGMYPFSGLNQRDSALGDVHNFFHPEGILWKFYADELKQFVREGHEKWEVETYEGQPLLPLTPQSLEWLRAARIISQSLYSAQYNIQVNFSLLPYPDQGPSASLVEVTRLNIGTQELVYRMGPPEWKDLSWPGDDGSNGAFLQVKVNRTWEILESEGWWGWFRLLERAQLTPINDSTFKVIWEFEAQSGQPLRIRYDLKLASSRNLFIPGVFSKFSCLESLW